MKSKSCQDALIKQMFDSFLFNLSRTCSAWRLNPELALDSEVFADHALVSVSNNDLPEDQQLSPGQDEILGFIPPHYYLYGRTCRLKKQRKAPP